MWRSDALRRWGMLLGVVALGASPAWALTITLMDANADYFDDGVDLSARGCER